MLLMHRQGPHLSIRIGIWILPSDSLFGGDLNCICFDHPNRETAMLSTMSPQQESVFAFQSPTEASQSPTEVAKCLFMCPLCGSV